MHFPLPPRLLLLLPTLALCAPLATLLPGELIPTARDVYGDIYNIDTAVRELDKTVQSFQGGPLLPTLAEGVPMLAGGVEIHRVNRIGFWHAVASLPFSVQESTEIIDAVLNSVNKSIPASTEHIKAKEPVFYNGGLSPVVITSLTLLLNDHDTFSAAVLHKVNKGISPAKMQEGQDAVANIHNAIQNAIDFYSAIALG